MDPIKEAFSKVREDMDILKSEIDSMKQSLLELCQVVEQLAKKQQEKKEDTKNQENPPQNTPQPTQNTQQIPQIQYIPQYIPIPAHMLENQTNQQINPAHILPYNPLNPKNTGFSTGNRGVPADRQTNQQTDKHTENSIENAAKMLQSLDNLKQEIKQKFKKLTEQEWVVFSTIYQLDNEAGHSDYRSLAERLKLTESSVRDYIARLIKKGIPVDKTKINNKEIQLNVSPSLKQIASLSAILTLRDI